MSGALGMLEDDVDQLWNLLVSEGLGSAFALQGGSPCLRQLCSHRHLQQSGGPTLPGLLMASRPCIGGHSQPPKHPPRQCWVLHCHCLLDTDPKFGTSPAAWCPAATSPLPGHTGAPHLTVHHHILSLR